MRRYQLWSAYLLLLARSRHETLQENYDAAIGIENEIQAWLEAHAEVLAACCKPARLKQFSRIHIQRCGQSKSGSTKPTAYVL